MMYISVVAFEQGETLEQCYRCRKPEHMIQKQTLETFILIFAVSAVNWTITTPIVCLICIFYTCLGGIKAVVWTDVLQAAAMLGSLVIVSIRATYFVGGLDVVLERNLNSTRIEALM